VADLSATALEKLRRWETVVAEETVHSFGGRVARLTGIDHDDRALRSRQEQRAVQARCPSADDDHVVRLAEFVAGESCHGSCSFV